MSIIEKIRAEVERRKKGNQKDESEHGEGAFYEDVAILSALSDLEKSENPINPTIEKLRALIKMQIRREELNLRWRTDYEYRGIGVGIETT